MQRDRDMLVGSLDAAVNWERGREGSQWEEVCGVRSIGGSPAIPGG